MANNRRYLVSDVAEIAGVSVRTLHHYDEIELLVPRGRTEAGYRLYDDEDLLRLQQILLGRELGLTLEEIRRSLDEPSFDRRRALIAQRAELEKRAQHTQAMLGAIDAAIAVIDAATDPALTRAAEVDMTHLFEGFDPSKYETEVEQRWGHTAAFKESQRRAASYTQADWERLKAEQNKLYADAFSALQAGKSPDDPQAMDMAERHRQSIERWFYPCSFEMHRGLAALYEQDPRFAENLDKHGPQLTPFLAAAIRENAKRHGA